MASQLIPKKLFALIRTLELSFAMKSPDMKRLGEFSELHRNPISL